MSNNKQSMKLYTEKEILEFLERKIIFDSDDLDELSPIELPSDEEIVKQGNLIRDIWEQTIYMSGAKWMRDLIQGGNK